MEILSRKVKRWWEYLSIDNKFNGFYTKPCTYKNIDDKKWYKYLFKKLKKNKPYNVVLCKPIEQMLQSAFDEYVKKLSSLSRWEKTKVFWQVGNRPLLKQASLYESFVFFVYSNGFADTYKEIHHKHNKERSDPQEFGKFCNGYLKSDQIELFNEKYKEPSGDSDDIITFISFCTDLGKLSALVYTAAEVAENYKQSEKILESLVLYNNTANPKEIDFLITILRQLCGLRNINSQSVNDNPEKGLKGILFSGLLKGDDSFTSKDIDNLINIAKDYVQNDNSGLIGQDDLPRVQKISSVLLYIIQCHENKLLVIKIPSEQKGKGKSLNMAALIRIALEDFGTSNVNSDARQISAYCSKEDSTGRHIRDERYDDFEKYYAIIKAKKL